MIDVKIEVRGAATIVRGLDKFADRIKREGLREAADAALASISKRTADGRDEKDRPFKPIRRQGSTILIDTGKMLASMRVLSSSSVRAEIGFSGAFEAKKAWWHQYGTGLAGPSHAKYPILPKNGKALAWRTSMSNANSIFLGRNKETGGVRGKRLTQSNARAGSRGLMVVAGVMHPGVAPRPFFGISPSDETRIQAAVDSFVKRTFAESGL